MIVNARILMAFSNSVFMRTTKLKTKLWAVSQIFILSNTYQTFSPSEQVVVTAFTMSSNEINGRGLKTKHNNYLQENLFGRFIIKTGKSRECRKSRWLMTYKNLGHLKWTKHSIFDPPTLFILLFDVILQLFKRESTFMY